MVTATQQTAAVGIAADALLTLVAAVVADRPLIRVLDLPGDLERPAAEPCGASPGSARGGLGVLVGTVVAMRDERLSKPGRHTDATGVPVDAPAGDRDAARAAARQPGVTFARLRARTSWRWSAPWRCCS